MSRLRPLRIQLSAKVVVSVKRAGELTLPFLNHLKWQFVIDIHILVLLVHTDILLFLVLSFLCQLILPEVVSFGSEVFLQLLMLVPWQAAPQTLTTA